MFGNKFFFFLTFDFEVTTVGIGKLLVLDAYVGLSCQVSDRVRTKYRVVR